MRVSTFSQIGYRDFGLNLSFCYEKPILIYERVGYKGVPSPWWGLWWA